MNILFICRGNVGRSQMAAAIFDSLTDHKYKVSSAGTRVINKNGESRDGQKLIDMKSGVEYVIEALKEKGLDITKNVRTQLNPSMVDDAEMIVVMAEQETIPDYLKNSKKATFFTVDDPKDTPYSEHKRILGEIETLIKKYISDNHL